MLPVEGVTVRADELMHRRERDEDAFSFPKEELIIGLNRCIMNILLLLK